MSAEAAVPSNSKFAWREVPRVKPPKRPVSDRLSDFHEVLTPYDEATASAQASRCVQCPNPNCVTACPLDVPIPELLALTAAGEYLRAAILLLGTQSLPEFAAHVCAGHHLCESACVLSQPSDPVPISSISQFLIDYGWKHGVKEPEPAPANGLKVAVIGSGLCGLVAADGLSSRGYAVTIFDNQEKPGGRLVNGMAGFRVDRAAVDRRIASLTERGVQFRLGIACGRDITLRELQKDFQAVLFALGRMEPVPFAGPGANLRGVSQAYPFLLQASTGANLRTPPIEVKGKRVVVLGGGDTAVDALRVALRKGAREAICLYRRDRDSMPADPDEVANSEEEGAQFRFLSQPIALGEGPGGRVDFVKCLRTELGLPDSAGRRAFRTIAGSDCEVQADVVLVAFGFAPPRLPPCDSLAELKVDQHGSLIVNSSQMTNLPGVFAAGSIVRWPASMIEVMRDARKAASDIDLYLAALNCRS